MYKLAVFIPESHLDAVKSALFTAGAGKIGNYDHCCWQCPGEGQFRPLQNSQPFIGSPDHDKPGKIEAVKEYKVEMVVADELIKTVIQALKQSHPYEEPAYDVWSLAEL